MSDNQNELYLMLGRIEGKMDSILAVRDDVDDLKDRMSKVENKHSFVLGAAVAASSFISGAVALVSFLWDKVKWH